MKITRRQLRRIIREATATPAQAQLDSSLGVVSKIAPVISKFLENDEALPGEEEEAASAAGKKLDKALDSSAMNAFKVALDQAKNKDQVKDVLSQIFNELGEDGKKYLQQALKELAAEI